MKPESSGTATPGCRIIHATESYEGKQGPTYTGGISAESAGATGLWLGAVTIMPGGRTRAHFHEHHESAIYVLAGEVDMWYGELLEQHDVARPGDYIYIPAGVPHVAVNRSHTEPVSAVVSRTDPNEQESVVLRPDLEERIPASPIAG